MQGGLLLHHRVALSFLCEAAAHTFSFLFFLLRLLLRLPRAQLCHSFLSCTIVQAACPSLLWNCQLGVSLHLLAASFFCFHPSLSLSWPRDCTMCKANHLLHHRGRCTVHLHLHSFELEISLHLGVDYLLLILHCNLVPFASQSVPTVSHLRPRAQGFYVPEQQNCQYIWTPSPGLALATSTTKFSPGPGLGGLQNLTELSSQLDPGSGRCRHHH